jgi:tetratricopeptide (TPR) repeat protein
LAYQTPPDAVEAEKAAREAIKFNPFLGYAQYHLGRALYMQGRFPEAMAAFDRCDELTGKSDVANLGRAQALGAQKRYAEAVAIMLKGRTLYASNDHYWLSSFYAGNGEKEKSLAALQKGFAFAISLPSTPTPHSLPSETTPASSNSSAATPNNATRTRDYSRMVGDTEVSPKSAPLVLAMLRSDQSGIAP